MKDTKGKTIKEEDFMKGAGLRTELAKTGEEIRQEERDRIIKIIKTVGATGTEEEVNKLIKLIEKKDELHRQRKRFCWWEWIYRPSLSSRHRTKR